MKLVTLIIISSIALVGVSLVIPSYIAYVSFTNEFEETVTSDLKLMASHAMDKINRMMNERIIDIQFLTSKSNLSLVGSQNSIKEKMEYLRDFERQTQVYSFISIYDSNGIKIGDTRNLEIGSDKSDEHFFSEAIQGKIYHNKIPKQSEGLGISIIHFSGPLYNDNGNINGVLTLGFSISKINDILHKDAIYSKPMEVHLTSNEGFILYSSHPHKGILTEVMDLTVMQNFMQSTDNSITFFENSDEGENSLFSIVKQQGFLQYEGDDWVLIFDIPSAILFEEQNQVLNNFVILSGIILSLAIMASIVLARYISSPIKALENKIKEIVKSDYDLDINIRGSEEIESMSESFQQMVKEIKKSSKQKEEFTSMIAHELKTPLTPIRGYADLLLSEKSGPLNEKQKKQIELIKENAGSLSRLISDFSDAQKLDLKVLKLNMKKIHLADPIKESIVNMRQEIEKCGITLTTSLEEQVTCFCDKQRIIQVLNNLLTNSMDFCPKSDGKIHITLQTTGKDVEITVKDNGLGMTEEQLSRVFTKFYQADSSMIREHGGSGLGLSICKGIIEGHGGTVQIESKIGKGTKVYIKLPKKSPSNQNTERVQDELETKQ